MVIDVYRFLNPYDLNYTWKVHSLQKRSRIHLAFANQNLMKHTRCPREVSDMVMVRVDFEKVERSHGIFKCPSELRLDISYQDKIHSTIREWLIDRQPESENRDFRALLNLSLRLSLL